MAVGPSQPITSKSCVQLSAACSDYCHALCNPFEAKPCGVPLAPIISTQKTKVYAKGTAHTGTTGYGYVCARPGHSAANNSTTVYYSDATYAGNTVEAATGAGMLSASTNAPFDSTQISGAASGVSFRLVAFGLRVRYTGTELNRGGNKVCLVDPTHNTVAGRTEADLLSDPQARKLPVSRNWTSLTWQPIITAEFEFNLALFGSAHFAVLLVSPDPAINLSFEWEAYSIIEYQGSIARAQTHTFADPVGFAAVQSVSSQMNSISSQPPAKGAQEMHKAVQHYVNSGISGVRAVADTATSIARGANTAWSIFEDLFEIAAPLLALL